MRPSQRMGICTSRVGASTLSVIFDRAVWDRPQVDHLASRMVSPPAFMIDTDGAAVCFALFVSHWLPRSVCLALIVSHWLSRSSCPALSVPHYLCRTGCLALSVSVSLYLSRTICLALSVSHCLSDSGCPTRPARSVR